MSTDFGDIELADAWDTDRTVDPLQLAMRLHRLRQEVDALAGGRIDDWDDLSGGDRQLALLVATETVIYVYNREPDNPAVLAEHVHESRVNGVGRSWDELTPDERQVGIDLMTLIVEWLEREGPR